MMTEYQIRRALATGLTYDIVVSIDGHPDIRRSYRTDADAQELLNNLTPMVSELIRDAYNEGFMKGSVA